MAQKVPSNTHILHTNKWPQDFSLRINFGGELEDFALDDLL